VRKARSRRKAGAHAAETCSAAGTAPGDAAASTLLATTAWARPIAFEEGHAAIVARFDAASAAGDQSQGDALVLLFFRVALSHGSGSARAQAHANFPHDALGERSGSSGVSDPRSGDAMAGEVRALVAISARRARYSVRG
jgi:hypothetical protein